MRTPSRARSALLSFVGLAVVLAGCATAPPPVKMADPAVVRADLYSQLDQAQALLPAKWANSDDPSPTDCAVGSTSGVTFTGNRGANGSAPESVRDRVAALWESLGFTTRRKDDIAPYRLVIATSKSDPENTLTFGLADNAMYLEGQGACGAGDLTEWVNIVNKELGQ